MIVPDLEASLRRAVRGEVRFDRASRAMYASDASNYRQVPIAVVVPRDFEDVLGAVAACRRHRAPVLARGAGTSQCGQGVNAAVVLDFSKYLHRVRGIDPAAKTAIVEPGTVCDELNREAARHGLAFGPDPATHSRCTLGGMIGNNACGPHSVAWGKTVDAVEALEVLTYDGARFWCGATSDEELRAILAAGGRRAEIYRGLVALRDRYGEVIRAGYPRIPRRVSGYNLDELLPERGFHVARALVGSEGTCAVVLAARVRLVEAPRSRALLVAGFPDIAAAADAVPEVLAARPSACEGLDAGIVEGLRARALAREDLALLPPGRGWLLVEFAAPSLEEARLRAEELRALLGGRVVSDADEVRRLWALRETGASATALRLRDDPGPDPVVGSEDAAVDPSRLGAYLRDFRRLLDRHGYRASLYGHFGDGCVHARIDFELRTGEGVARFRRFLGEAAELVAQYGGSLSGEHGDGQAKAEWLPAIYGAELMQAMREFKRLWDPLGGMNPGKLVDAGAGLYRADQNLRLGPDYRPLRVATRLAYASDIGEGWAREMERCIGMAKCRSLEGGAMCPSYRATREERHSPRGRARLLAELLRGEVLGPGWAEEEVREALEGCLGCKACRSECPTRCDVAAYKAEFFSHYYEERRRPLALAWLAHIGRWAPAAARLAPLANALAQGPAGRLAKSWLGIAEGREFPRFAPRTLRRLAARHAPARARRAGERVILFPDTFTEHFRPEAGLAALRLIESVGGRPELPRERLCCGRPLYEAGLLEAAAREAARVLEVLAPALAEGAAVVVLEPACLSVFRDELKRLLPEDARALVLARSALGLGEFLRARGWRPSRRVTGDVFLHVHCHQQALWGSVAERELLAAAGYAVLAPETGCCGMGGAFGYRRETWPVSVAIAEAGLLPALRQAGEARVVADGFACASQIASLGGKRPLHLATALECALA